MWFDNSPHPLSPVLAEERRLLGDLRELLARDGNRATPLATLRQALADLDYLFLLVIAGEFNAGKSALINTLLGQNVVAEGVTPTTAAVTLLSYGARAERVDRADGLLEIRHPLPILRDLVLVDTPGTNAILRHHERLTQDFIPRSDLLLFVTSADRPFTESERAFLEQIRGWGKKVVLVLNKVDLLSSAADVESQVSFIREGAQRLLGLDPPIWPVSASLARAAQNEPDEDRKQKLLEASGFQEFQAYVQANLDNYGRLRLKLLSGLGVADKLLAEQQFAVDQRVAVLHGDRETAARIERYLVEHVEDQRREFEFRVDRLTNLFHDLTERGQRFFQQNIRLARVFDLVNAEKVSGDFEREVVADVPQRVDDLAQELIDWLVDQDQRLWRWVTREVERQAESGAAPERARMELPFVEDRRAVLQEMARTAREVVRRHDHRREAEQLATSVREAVTRTTLVEAGALGLGAVTLAVVGSAAADVTGLLAAGALAGLGLYLLPLKRRRVEQQFRERTNELRETLTTALRREFERSLNGSTGRVRAALVPYDRFVQSELERLQAEAQELHRLSDGFSNLRSQIDSLAPPQVGSHSANRGNTADLLE